MNNFGLNPMAIGSKIKKSAAGTIIIHYYLFIINYFSALRRVSILSLVLPLVLIAASCGEPECGSIDLSKVNEIKLPDKVRPASRSLDEFMRELDHDMHKTHRLILRCKSENELQYGNVLPGVMLWISDSWNLRNDTSVLGKIFAKAGVNPWERVRVTALLYNRHLNGRELKPEMLFDDSHTRIESNGRILHKSALDKFNDEQKKELHDLIEKNDSALTSLNIREFNFNPVRRAKLNLEKKRLLRQGLLERLTSIGWNLQDNIPEAKNSKDSLTTAVFQNDPSAALPDKLIRLEKIRQQLIIKSADEVYAAGR